jgi:hypothetical protein
MLIFKHRINTSAELNVTDPEYGLEFDVRSDGKNLYIHHDAFAEGEKFSDWVQHYRHSGMIVNTKCEGMEEEIIGWMIKLNVNPYFLLDMSIPFMIKWSRKGFRNMAVRYSEFEPLEFTLRFAGLADWVWLDCFNGKPAEVDQLLRLKEHFKICAVSPELQGYDKSKISEFRAAWSGVMPDAICTKVPDDWK